MRSIFTLFILGLALQQALTATQDVQRNSINPNIAQTEIRHVGLLLLDNGKAEEIGFMKLPLRVLNENGLKSHQTSRFKKWDVYDVISNDFYFAVAIYNLGSVGLIRSVLFDYNTGKQIVVTKTSSGDHVPNLSHTSYRYANGTPHSLTFHDELHFRVENIESDLFTGYFSRAIQSSSKDHGFGLDVNVNVTFDQEGIAAVTPLDETRQHFLYEINSGNLPIEGSLKVGDNEYLLNHENAGAGHAYARGVFTDNTYLIRARGQGVLEDGRRFSLFLNTGYGHTNTSEATTDAFVVDRFTYKLNAVDVAFDENDLTGAIKFDTVFSGRKDFKECHVTFTPSFSISGEGTSAESDLIVGTFNGYVTDYKNKVYSVDNIRGAVELLRLRISEQSN